MIEAMACGTPVIAYRSGSVPEVIDEGVTGFIVDDIDGAVEEVGRLDRFDRAACRTRFEQRFSVERMANDYMKVYEQLIEAASQWLGEPEKVSNVKTVVVVNDGSRTM